MMGDPGPTDYDPPVVVMRPAGAGVEGLHPSLNKPKGRKAWLEAMTIPQKDCSLGHNTFVPCRTRNQAFEPVTDDRLLTLFQAW